MQKTTKAKCAIAFLATVAATALTTASAMADNLKIEKGSITVTQDIGSDIIRKLEALGASDALAFSQNSNGVTINVKDAGKFESLMAQLDQVPLDKTLKPFESGTNDMLTATLTPADFGRAVVLAARHLGINGVTAKTDVSIDPGIWRQTTESLAGFGIAA